MLLVTTLFLACPPLDGSGGTEDVRVDHARGDAESTSPRTCVNENGVVYTTWQDDRDGNDHVWFNKSADAGVTFLAGDELLSNGKGDARNPVIACSGDYVYVAWEDTRDGELEYENIYLQWSDDGGRSWQDDDIQLDGDPDGDFMSKAPAIAAAGDNVWVAWSDQVNGAYDIFVQRSQDNGERWLDAPVRVDTDEAGAAYSSSPVIVGDEEDHVVVAWEDRRDGNSDIYVNFSIDNGESFSSSDRRLDEGDEAGATNSFEPQIAMDGENVYVAWHDERFGENKDVFLNLSRSYGDGWKDSVIRMETDAEGIADSQNPSIVARDGGVWVAFQDNRASGYDIFLQYSADAGVAWLEEEYRMDSDGNGQAQSFEPHVTVSGDTWLVAWQDRRNDSGDVGFNDLFYNYTVDAGSTWQAGDLRINSNETGTAYAIDHGVAVFEERIITVWADGRAGSSDIWAASRPLGINSVYVAPDED
ncbi:MAG: hypothetical protein FJ090_21545 [Deltaproteobacteria bacterium]|nr:hypothetical protein [Deltaproteobacteria bacterium]